MALLGNGLEFIVNKAIQRRGERTRLWADFELGDISSDKYAEGFFAEHLPALKALIPSFAAIVFEGVLSKSDRVWQWDELHDMATKRIEAGDTSHRWNPLLMDIMEFCEEDLSRPKKPKAADLAVFFESDFPNMATHCKQAECGFSIYKGLLIQWDEDRDTRILAFIDKLNHAERKHLLIAAEHEGTLSLKWDKTGPPEKYRPGEQIEILGDYWTID